MSEVDLPGADFRIIHRQTPGSSAIERIGYNPLTQDLYILFKKDGRYPEYVFGGIVSQRAEDFMTAPSPGTYYHQNIRGNKLGAGRRALGSFRLGAIRRNRPNAFGF